MKRKISAPLSVHPAFDAVLLTVLAVPVAMRYNLNPVGSTNYIIFGILFLLLLSNIIFSLWRPFVSSWETWKNWITWAVVILVLFGSMVSEIGERGRIARNLNHHTHDIILQLEAAIQYLNQGKNPYKETYFGTPMEQWYYAELGEDAVNPALYHFVMPPWYLFFSYPFYGVSKITFGFFDGRMPLLFCFAVLLFLLFRWIRQPVIARLMIIIIAFNPGTVDYLIEGRSDMFALSFLVAAIYALSKKKYMLSSIAMGLAALSKQTIWFATPLYGLLLYASVKKNIRRTLLFLSMCILTVVIVSAPFFLWDGNAFIRSVVFYLNGNTLYGYPVSGYGLGMILYQWGIIKNIHDYYPFIAWQLVLFTLGMYVIIRYVGTAIKISGFFILYGIILSLVWYVSRYFNNSHVGFLTTLFVIGILKQWDERESV